MGLVGYFESRKLNEHELCYVTHDLELATIMHALNMEALFSWEEALC
jgi:hypothetical protein